MQSRFVSFVRWAVIFSMFIVAAFTIYELPHDSLIAVHWNANGEPDRWMGKWPGLLTIPMVAFLMSLMISAKSNDNGNFGNLKMSSSGQKKMLLPLLLVLLVAELLISVNALGYNVDPSIYIAVAIGILFIFIGASAQALSFGVTIGFSTPITTTQDNGGGIGGSLLRWAFVISGLLIVTIAFTMSGSERALGLIALAVGVPVFAFFYSFFKSRKLGKR
jgi:uncharacterized membrane protein